MWPAQILVGIIFTGILFMLWVLLHLFREQPLRMRELDLAMPLKRVAMRRLRLEQTWATATREQGTVILHSTWRYGLFYAGANQTSEIQPGETSCETWSSYL